MRLIGWLGFVGIFTLAAACTVAVDDGGEEAVDDAQQAAWSCPGLAGTTPSPTGSYYVTSFGCWKDQNGNPHGDPGDNCIPACKGTDPTAYAALCGNKSGPQCERDVGWYTADADRYGCGTRLLVTNVENGKAAVLAVLDRGPNCKIEKKVSHWVLDMSYPASQYLFGGAMAATEKGEVHVEVVGADTPLGPWSGPAPDPVEPPPDPDPGALTVIVDSNNANNDADARCTVSSNWRSSSNVSGYWDTGYFWRSTGSTTDPASFEIYLDTPRTMIVDAWWPAASDRSSSAPWLVYDAQGNLLDTVFVDQKTNGSQWNTLGTYDLTAGWNEVALSRWTTAGSVVVADAVRFRTP